MPKEIHTPVTGEELAHAFEEEAAPVDLGRYAFEDWVTLLVFWLMAGAVFLQFFTRYVLNDSFAWTEEIAIYCLIGVVFLGSAMCVRLSRHIHVDFLYRYLPRRPARVLATLVDLLRIAFFAYGAVLVWRYAAMIPDEKMTTIDLPKSIVFHAVILGFVLMTLRAVQVAITDFRRGWSTLERPGAFDGSEA
ncbi:TRAP transporter small permease [Benzoatithermus flavus]|uniref:TRAP transporter small permease protein n=1 Tax=Benzoatithermus flavus TaxID=3108223 RepID=A0ABU8XVK9_9PROT